jgi:hypothetical protein
VGEFLGIKGLADAVFGLLEKILHASFSVRLFDKSVGTKVLGLSVRCSLLFALAVRVDCIYKSGFFLKTFGCQVKIGKRRKRSWYKTSEKCLQENLGSKQPIFRIWARWKGLGP